MPSRGPAWRRALRLLLLLPDRVALASPDGQCDALTDLMARLINPGFWAPAFVFRSLDAQPTMRPPPKRSEPGSKVALTGICKADSFRAERFTWQRPTSDGGDWIATALGDAMMEVVTDTYRCPLTGIAVTTTGLPTLRLQFEECPRKTAVEVQLTNSTAGQNNTVKLVDWMCQVAEGSRLCQDAAADLAEGKDWGDRRSLDLAGLAWTLSRGLKRIEVYNECFENLDWLAASNPLPIDPAELRMLLSMSALLAPSSWPTATRIPADITEEPACMEDCSGAMSAACTPATPAPSVKPGAAAPVSRPRYKGFVETFHVFGSRYDDPVLLPWLAYVCGGLFLLGSALACCFSPCRSRSGQEHRKVSGQYHGVPDEASYFSTP